jgi:50S ribosomal subunit-associated GTPase HflX
MRGQKVIIAALVSAKATEATAHIEEVCARVQRLGGIIAGTVVQRRGVSRASRPGGARQTSAPLAAATWLGAGKVEEIRAMRESSGATLVVVCNPLSATQRARLEELIGAVVITEAEVSRHS